MKTITENALLSRINRKLAHEDQRMHRCRENSRELCDWGRYYVRNTSFNSIDDTHCDLENSVTNWACWRNTRTDGRSRLKKTLP